MNYFLKFVINFTLVKTIQIIINLIYFFLKEFIKKFNDYKKYKKFNYKFTGKNNKDGWIIVEMFKFNQNIISFFFWKLFFLKKGYKNFYCYPPKINKIYNPITFYIYKILGFKIINYWTNYKQEKLLNKICSKINLKKISKKQFLKIKYKNIKIGDLIYDDYLRFNKKPTVNFNDPKFKEILKDGFRIAIFWENYFKKNKIDYICYSHHVYLIGIPARVSLNFKTSNLNICGDNTFRMSKDFLYNGDQFFFLKKRLLSYFKKKKIKSKIILKDIDREIAKKMKGKIKNLDDLPFHFKKIYDPKYSKKFELKNKINIKKNKFNILVATHDFFEGPNSEGEFIFPDYYTWLKYLFNYANKCKNKNFAWYIKPHPDFDIDQFKILRNIIPNNENIILLPVDTPNYFLIKKGINFVLTNHGTISPEFAYNNIPSLLCSNSNFFSNFNFAIKCNDLNEYKKNLDKISKLNVKINKQDVLMYFYYQKHFFNDPIKFTIFPKQTVNANPIINLSETVFSDNNLIINETYNKFSNKEQKLNRIFEVYDFFIKNKNLFQLIDINKVV